MFTKISLLMVLTLSIFTTGCFSDISGTPSDLEEYEKNLKEANKDFLNKDYQNAERRTKAALEIAERIKWKNGIIHTKLRLGKLYLGDRKLDEAEDVLKQVKAMCEAGSCSANDLGYVYDDLFLLYLWGFKDISKAEKVVEEVISNQQNISSDKRVIKDKLRGYVIYMKDRGYEQQAESLSNRIKLMP